jgi:hypothetical protein
MTFTNSIFSSVTTNGTLGSVTLNGSYNGFYPSSAPTFGSSPISVGSYPYQTVGGGEYYLASGSPFLTAGITNVGAALLAQLQNKTVCAPKFLSTNFTTDMTLGPLATRDNSGNSLALGWHYDPVDYVSSFGVSNAVLTLGPGTVVANYPGGGIWLEDGSQLVSQGTPNQRNYLVYYNLVQEQPGSVACWTRS